MDTYEPHPTVMWELTRACDLRCRGCAAGNDWHHGSNELTTYEAYKTLDQIAALQPRELIVTGGDPLERSDVGQIIDYARRRGLDPALVLSPTSQLTFEMIAQLQRDGLTQAIFSVDGSNAAVHQSVHGAVNSFAMTLRAMRWAECARLRIEVNTLVCRANMRDLSGLADLIRPFGIARWNLHFLVPVGGSKEIEMITAAEVEEVFAAIEEIRAPQELTVRVIEAPHYRRFRLERSLDARLSGGIPAPGNDSARDLLACARDGARSFVYISHAGDVRPSEFVPQSAGNLRYRPLGDIYRGSDLFVALRNPDNLKGRCGRCDFRHACGGSRARAWAMTGDLFGSDPLCAYDPPSVVPTLGGREASA